MLSGGVAVVAFVLPEDHAVDVAELRLERVNDLLLCLAPALDRAPELDQPRELPRLDALDPRIAPRLAGRNPRLLAGACLRRACAKADCS